MTRWEQLSFLIKQLQHEMPEYGHYAVPQDEQEAFNLFRALCNVRPPGPASAEFLAVEHELLQAVTAAKGITEAADLAPTRLDARLSLWQGDITTLRCDAIVNAANSQLCGCFSPLHGCIDNIIHTMAGVELREHCARLMREQGHEEPTGQAKLTPGYNLPARYVLHTVGPIVRDGRLRPEHEAQLASCYRACLDCADAQECATVAFCCISTGVFGFPAGPAAQIAVQTVREWLDEQTSDIHVIFNVFKDSDLELYRGILEE